ncbi:uncharacterized protein LOC124495762 [Dermatophagoides farinae]|uniref:uncharacterized protein LOC124495762 n=1 Tax=Dermatophagoides farinae TaxID=6954 RepID=UPI003F5DBA7F
MANTRIHTLEKSNDVTYSNSKLFNDDFLTNKAIGADHIVNKENEIISGKLFFCIEKFVFSNQTNDKIISLIGDESSIVGRKFVREFQSLVGFLVDDLNEIFAIPPPDSVLREVSLKLFFEHPDLSKRYETEMKAGFFSDELFVNCLQKKLRNKFQVAERKLKIQLANSEFDRHYYLERKKNKKISIQKTIKKALTKENDK